MHYIYITVIYMLILNVVILQNMLICTWFTLSFMVGTHKLLPFSR